MANVLQERLARKSAGLTQLNFDPTGRDEARLVEVPLRLIVPDPNQPRKQLGELADLALSIGKHGVIQPIVVEPLEDGNFRILAGERRYAACRRLGKESMPCLVRTVKDQARLELQLMENLHRQDLSPVEIALAYNRLMVEFELDQKALALRLGKSPSSVNETLRILDINPELLEKVRTSEHLTKSMLLEIAKETDPHEQLSLLEKAQSGDSSVRDVREKKGRKAKRASRGAKATIELPEGKVVIHFHSGDATPERIIEGLELALSSQRSQG